jgi:hypothetical protein
MVAWMWYNPFKSQIHKIKVSAVFPSPKPALSPTSSALVAPGLRYVSKPLKGLRLSSGFHPGVSGLVFLV